MRVLQLVIFYNGAVTHDFHVAFVRVDNDVKIVITLVFLANLYPKSLFNEGHKGDPVDVLFVSELAK